MKIRMKVGKIYPAREFETLKGNWRVLEAVLRGEEQIVRSDGSTGTVCELIAIRIHGEQIDRFLAEVHEGSEIEAQVRFDIEERTSSMGSKYVQNKMTFSCPEWKVVG